MKIVFMCGCLEPGRDGVGDYIYRLSLELTHRSHQVKAIALNDHYIDQEFSVNQLVTNSVFITNRLPSIWSATKRFDRAKDLVETFDPEWISLQFVPFSFQRRGLAFNLANQLNLLAGERRWHIMFHELWVLTSFSESIKLWLLGVIQKQIIRKLIISLSPNVIHTQTRYYQEQLIRIGFKSSLLPLFSNIPISFDNKINLDISHLNYYDIKFVAFGSIHSDSLIKQFALECASYSQSLNIKICLIFVGRSGVTQKSFANIWSSLGMEFIEFGEQSTETVSAILSSSSYGISTTPYFLIEKSGSVTAMLDHKLPVLCISKPGERLIAYSRELVPGVYQYHEKMLATWFKSSKGKQMNTGISVIAKRFTEDLYIGSN